MKLVNRVGLYFIGLFIITIGINLSIISSLGISPVSAFTLPLSEAVNISLGTITIITYVIFVLIQILVLKKNFKKKNLLQAPFSFAFGFFVDFTGQMLSGLNPQTYTSQFILMILGIIICAFGATIYIIMDIVPNAPEGLNLALSERLNMPFSKIKIICDCLFVLIGVIISLIFLGGVTAIREGTLISALLTGKLIGLFTKWFEPGLKKIAFNDNDEKQLLLNEAM